MPYSGRRGRVALHHHAGGGLHRWGMGAWGGEAMPAETALTRLCGPYAIEPQDLEGLTRAARTLHLGPHQALEGSPARGCELLLVERGELRMAMRSVDGHELLLALARRNDSNRADLLGGRRPPRPPDLRPPRRRCRVWPLPGPARCAAPALPRPGAGDPRAVARRAREITDRLVEMAFLPLEDRLGALLARWAQRSGRCGRVSGRGSWRRCLAAAGSGWARRCARCSGWDW